AGDQAVAVDPYEALAEFILQRFQRLLDQVFAVCMVDDDVLFLGLQVVHVVQRDQPQAAAQARAQVATRGRGVRRAAFTTGGEGAHAFQRRGQALGADRLDQVVDRLGLEGGQRVGVVG